MDQRNDEILGVGYYGVNDPEISKLYLNALLTSQKRWDYAQELKSNTVSNLYNTLIDPKSEPVLREYIEDKVNEITNYIENNFNGDWGRSIDYLKEVLPKLNAISNVGKEAYQQYLDKYKMYEQLKSQGKLTGKYGIDDEGNIVFTPYSFDDYYNKPYLNRNEDRIELDLSANFETPTVKWDSTNIVNKAINALNSNMISTDKLSKEKLFPDDNQLYLMEKTISKRGMNLPEFLNFVEKEEGKLFIDKLVDEVLSDPVARKEFNGDRDLIKKFLINEISTGLSKQYTENKRVNSRYDNNLNDFDFSQFSKPSIGAKDEVIDKKDVNDNVKEVDAINNFGLNLSGDNYIKKSLNNIKDIMEKNLPEDLPIRTGSFYPNITSSYRPKTVEKISEQEYKFDSSAYGNAFKVYRGPMEQFGILRTDGNKIIVNKELFNKFYNFHENNVSTISAKSFDILTDDIKDNVIKFINNSGGTDINSANIKSVSFNFVSPKPTIKYKYVKNGKMKDETAEIPYKGVADVYNVGHKVSQIMIVKNASPNDIIFNFDDVETPIMIDDKFVKKIKLIGYKPEDLSPIFTITLIDGREEIEENISGNDFLYKLSIYFANMLSSSVKEEE